jgi:hypothetical protein
MSAVWHGAGGHDPLDVDESLLRVRQLRGALVCGPQFLPSFRTADVITSWSPLSMAVIDVSRPLVPWTWRDAFVAPLELFAMA